MVGGKEIRRTLKTRNWQRASKIVREMEAEDKEPDERITIEHACMAFIQELKARNLRKPSIDRYTPLIDRLKKFALDQGLNYINQFDLGTLRTFRTGWKVKNYTARNELERLRALFRFVHEADWIVKNPAVKLKSPQIESAPSLPFSKDEINRILAACNSYDTTLPVKAFVLTLRYSGLRIRDVVTLTQDKINDGKLFLRTAKTGTVVHLPLPPIALDALAVIPNSTYYFWSGHGQPKTRVANYQHILKKIFENAKIVHGFAHRFRDTFAVELLLKGTPIERVSVLLGHASIKVTERHYAPWVQARQDQLEEDIRKTC